MERVKESIVPITNRQIESLMREASNAGDVVQAAICLAALGHDGPEVDDIFGGRLSAKTAKLMCSLMIERV